MNPADLVMLLELPPIQAAATGTGVILGISAILLGWGRWTRISPEIAAALALAGAGWLGLSGPLASLLAPGDAARLLALSLFWTFARFAPPQGGPVALAAAGGLIGGPVAALLAARKTDDPSRAALLALVASATAAASPLGAAAPLLISGADPRFPLLALPPAILCAVLGALALRTRSPGEKIEPPPVLRFDAGIAAILALIVGGVAQRTSVTVAVAAVLGGFAALRGFKAIPQDSPLSNQKLELSWPLRESASAIVLGAVAQAGGTAWVAGLGLRELSSWQSAEALATALGAAIGIAFHPDAAALLAARVLAVDPRAPLLLPIACGLAAAPAAALLAAASVHGPRVLKLGVPLGILQTAIFCGWAIWVL